MNRRIFFVTLAAPFLARFRKLWPSRKFKNVKYVEWYFSQGPCFQFGFTGFKEAAASVDTAGQFIVGSNLLDPGPRTMFKTAGGEVFYDGPSPYWHGQPPFVLVNMKPPAWEVKL